MISNKPTNDMKKVNYLLRSARRLINIVVFVLAVLSLGCANEVQKEQHEDKIGATATTEILWHVKAVTPEGRFLDIKAVDAFGTTYEVKAIEKNGQTSFMDIKAYINGKILPVKIIVNKDKYTPVKAIAQDGSVYNIKAIAPNGERLRINGVRRSGNIIHLKAITKNGDEYGVKAISPKGQLNDVKGFKMRIEALEFTMYGSQIYAHVKALAQTGEVGDNFFWHIVAIHPEGYTLDVKAMDSKGNLHDVKAILDEGQRYLLNVNAFVDNDEQLPVKMLMSDDPYKPMAAIGNNGEVYDIIITSRDGDRLDVKGFRRVNNIIDIKVLNVDGIIYAVKALSQKGDLYDVKGIKFLDRDIEIQIQGIDIYAHVKALPQAK